MDEIYKQWMFTKNIKTRVDNVSCICGRNISQIYWVKNILNGNVLAIGSECIKKFKNDEMTNQMCHEKNRRNYEKLHFFSQFFIF